MTFDEYFKSVNGKGIDYDGNYGVQCFDLVNDYAEKVLGCKPFIGMYAWEIFENFAAQPSSARFTRIANTPDFVPIKGDIVVWSKSLNGKAGHCAVATGEGDKTWFTSYEQNWTGNNDPCTIVKHDYSHVLGVLRPKEQANITGKAAKQVTIKGIDVSMHQGNIDFAKVKADGVKFVIIRCNNWNREKNCFEKDPYFEQNYKQAKAAGLDVGVYYVDYPALIKSGGFNGYPKQDALKELDTEGFKRGDKSLGVYYLKQRLKVLGYKLDDTCGFGGGTEQAVNKLLTLWGYKPNGIAGKKFAELVMK